MQKMLFSEFVFTIFTLCVSIFSPDFVASASWEKDELVSFGVKGQSHSMIKCGKNTIFGVAQQVEAYRAGHCASSTNHLV